MTKPVFPLKDMEFEKKFNECEELLLRLFIRKR